MAATMPKAAVPASPAATMREVAAGCGRRRVWRAPPAWCSVIVVLLVAVVLVGLGALSFVLVLVVVVLVLGFAGGERRKGRAVVDHRRRTGAVPAGHRGHRRRRGRGGASEESEVQGQGGGGGGDHAGEAHRERKGLGAVHHVVPFRRGPTQRGPTGTVVTVRS